MRGEREKRREKEKFGGITGGGCEEGNRGCD